MKKKVLILVVLILSVFSMTMPTFCESGVIFTDGAKAKAKARAEGRGTTAVIQGANGKGENIESNDMRMLNNADCPAPVGKDYTRVTHCPSKIPFTIVIDTPYKFIQDEYGNIGIAYFENRLNMPITANGGFYVLQKQNDVTKEVEWVKYCVDNSGYILFGWVVEGDGTRYYLSEDVATLGQVVKGTMVFSDGKTYYFDEDGICQGNS